MRVSHRPSAASFALLSLSLLTLLPRPTSAYSSEGLVRPGCHERITSEALRRIRAEPSAARPVRGSRNERALIDDVQFDLEGDMKDLGAVTLLLGVRDNDLKGHSVDDLTAMAQVHGDPRNQDEHCLRGADGSEPGATEAALHACRALIRERVLEALDSLDPEGQPDPAARTSLRVYLSLRGQMDADLPAYYVRMGQALHALQDSFTHSYRTPDGLRVTVSLNWLEVTKGTWIESRDGPAHASRLDECVDLDPFLTNKLALATQASTELLAATLGAARSRAQKVADVDAVLDRYLTYAPGCIFQNGWCQAVERKYADSSGCGVAGGAPAPGSGLVALMAMIGLALLHRARRGLVGLGGALVIATLAASPARADEGPPAGEGAAALETSGDPDEGGVPPPVLVPVPEAGPLDPSETTWGVYLGGFGSLSKGAVGADLGVRLRVSRHWTFGLDAEWNPWLAFNGPTPIRRGVANLYGAAILRFPLAYESFNLATTLNVGVSYLLDDLYGAPAGSVGPYLGVSPLGLEWKLSSAFLLIINPLGFALPVPKVTGVPLWFPQYRFSIGLAVMAG